MRDPLWPVAEAERLAHCYEQLRSEALERRRPPEPPERGIGRTVLIRQGMVAWIHLCAAAFHKNDKCLPGQATERDPAVPAPIRSELMVVLTNLVFDTCGQQVRA